MRYLLVLPTVLILSTQARADHPAFPPWVYQQEAIQFGECLPTVAWSIYSGFVYAWLRDPLRQGEPVPRIGPGLQLASNTHASAAWELPGDWCDTIIEPDYEGVTLHLASQPAEGLTWQQRIVNLSQGISSASLVPFAGGPGNWDWERFGRNLVRYDPPPAGTGEPGILNYAMENLSISWEANDQPGPNPQGACSPNGGAGAVFTVLISTSSNTDQTPITNPACNSEIDPETGLPRLMVDSGTVIFMHS